MLMKHPVGLPAKPACLAPRVPRRPSRKVPWQRENFKNNIFTCMNWSISQISLSNNVLQYSKIDIFKSKFLLWNGISISKNSEIKIWYRPSGGLLLLDMHFRTQWGQIASTSYSFWFKGEGRLWQQFLQKAHSYQQCLTWNKKKKISFSGLWNRPHQSQNF